MNKKDLIAKVSEALETTKKDAEVTVNTVLDCIVDGLIENSEVKLAGLFNLSLVDQPERECRNPKTGEKIIAPACKKIKFKVSSALKDKVQ